MASAIPHNAPCFQADEGLPFNRSDQQQTALVHERLEAATAATLALVSALGLKLAQPQQQGRAHRTECPANDAYNDQPDSVTDTLLMARSLNTAMAIQDQMLGSDLIGAPIWPLMLDLYINQRQHTNVSVSSACIASRLPQTTALRWIAVLEAAQFIQRIPDQRDGRRWFLKLTNFAIEKIEAILQAVAESNQKLGVTRSCFID